jgi:predicted ribosome quality control (RQC) complex YloA/Tae2 family protein
VPDERIVEIVFASKRDARTIICELTGEKANILVLDAERRILRDLLHQPARIGQPYTPPLATRSSGQPGPSRFSSAEEKDFPISTAIARHYHEKESTLTADAARAARLRALKKTFKKVRTRVDAWRADLAKAAMYRDYARYGELIKANLGSIQKGIDRITVMDYFDDRLPDITIPLDPTKSAQGNLDEYFRKHRKYLAADRELRPRIMRAEQELEALRLELKAIDERRWIPPTAPLSPPGPGRIDQPTTRRSRQAGDRRPFRRFTSTDGLPIFIGRNARENEELTFGLAKSDDLWLHARGIPGSHVVVRIPKGTDPPPETVHDAATLALLYSDLKRSGKGDVIYTRRKWVKKAKDKAPGAVTVTQEKTIHVTLDKKRLDAIKARASS